MNYKDLNTVVKIAKFTNDLVKTYRHDKEKIAIVITGLTPLFASDAEGWKMVIDMGKFRNGFTRILGKGGMKALKDLLYELDKKKYQKIDFGIEN